MKVEMEELKENKTSDLVKLPKGRSHLVVDGFSLPNIIEVTL